jgi:hypothetical protein
MKNRISKAVGGFCLIAMAAVLLGSCNKDRVKGSGPVTSEQRNVTGFTGITVNGATDIFISQGTSFDVKVKAYSNLLPYFETKVEDGILSLGYRRNTNVSNDNSQVYITMPSINLISLSGSSDIICTGIFPSTTDMSAAISGSGSISIAGGAADNFTVKISGSGDVKAFGFDAKKADITISGSGNVEVNVAESLEVAISGSGNILYKGSPAVINSQISGSGKLIKQ